MVAEVDQNTQIVLDNQVVLGVVEMVDRLILKALEILEVLLHLKVIRVVMEMVKIMVKVVAEVVPVALVVMHLLPLIILHLVVKDHKTI